MIVRNSATGQCKTCGADLSKAPGTCDREGRVLGGLAAIPGFGWWPIKAYRPCPGLSSAGVDYVRCGADADAVHMIVVKQHIKATIINHNPYLLFAACRKGQPTNEMLFGGVSLSESQRESLGVMKETADKGIDIEL
jgi:hypothetical protein